MVKKYERDSRINSDKAACRNYDTGKPERTLTVAAIEYDGDRDAAPRVTAVGRNLVAERIVELARKHGVPVKEDPALVDILSRLNIDENIPPELYGVVAELLAFVYAVNDEYGKFCRDNT